MSLAIEGPQPFFDDVVDHMAANCNAPIAIVVLTEVHRQWVSGAVNSRGGEVNPEETYDALRLMGPEKSVVSDTAKAFWFDTDGADAERSGIRSFIGEPMVHEEKVVGHVYLADVEPRTWEAREIAYLQRSSRLIVAQAEARSMIAERDRRIELERDLAQMGTLYRTVVDHLCEGVTVMNRKGEILATNPQAAKLVGLTQDQMEGRTPLDPTWHFFDEEGERIANEENNAILAIQSGEPRIGVIQGVYLPSGEKRWMHVNSVPVWERGADKPTRVVNTFRDITDERARDRKLMDALSAAEAAVDAKQQFLASMSHEIRTPLNGVVGLAQALRMTKLDAEQEDLVDTILESSTTLNAILNDVLDLSKIEAGKFEIVPSTHDVGEFFRRLMQLWKPRALEKGLQLEVALDSDLPEQLSFDGVRVQQCLNNLVSNAVKFTSAGEVKIAAETKTLSEGDLMLTISVTDSGVGMDEVTLARLFQPFTQANELVASQHGGTGLGLSITRRLADLMGGEVGARSEVGKGSTFHFSFRASPPAGASKPVEETSEAATAKADAPRGEDEPMRVLVVDDNPVNRQVVILFLKPLGAKIVQAENGEEALAAMEAERFDIVLLDMHMPVLDGPGAIARIRASEEDWSQTPVIAVTADAMSGDKERYLAMGLDGYLPKPVNAKHLMSEIQRLTGAGIDGDLLEAG